MNFENAGFAKLISHARDSRGSRYGSRDAIPDGAREPGGYGLRIRHYLAKAIKCWLSFVVTAVAERVVEAVHLSVQGVRGEGLGWGC